MINNYASLQTEIASWLMRGDLTSMIPSFIQNAEAVITRRMVGGPSKVDTLDVDTNVVIPLPADCRMLTSLTFLGTDPPYTPRPGSMEEVATLRQANRSGKPTTYAVISAENGLFLYTDPLADALYTAEITYEPYFKIADPFLSPGGVNALIAKWPDLYLYGALVESAPYLKADPRLPMWEQRFNRILQEIRLFSDRQKFGNNPVKRRLANPMGT